MSKWLKIGSIVAACLVALIAVELRAIGTQSPSVGDQIECPTNGDILPVGSLCVVGEEGTNTIASLGTVEPPCDRVSLPPGAISGSCEVLTSGDAEIGGSAWVVFHLSDGSDVCVFTLPGGREFGPTACPQGPQP